MSLAQRGFHICTLALTGAMVLGGCAKGVEAESFTFGPGPGSDDGNPPATDTGPIDPTNVDSTTGSATGNAESDGPVDDTTGDGDNPGTTDDGPGSTTDPTDPMTSSSSDGGEESSSSDDGPPPPVCGDDMIEGTEQCDGADLGGMTCPDIDAAFTGGTLACDGSCAFDTTLCTAAENPIVMCQVVNAAIPDNDPTGLTDTITLPAEVLGGTIADVDVEVELDHSWIGDLQIDLTTNFTTATVFLDECGSEDNLHYTFDDSGAAIDCANSDANAVVVPTQALSVLNGSMVSAEWTLSVEDQAAADTGTLTQWCVSIGWM